LYKPIEALKQQKLYVLNYEHETHALACRPTFKVGSFKCAIAFMFIIYNI